LSLSVAECRLTPLSFGDAQDALCVAYYRLYNDFCSLR